VKWGITYGATMVAWYFLGPLGATCVWFSVYATLYLNAGDD
jgi:hypothetical protein